MPGQAAVGAAASHKRAQPEPRSLAKRMRSPSTSMLSINRLVVGAPS
jgi:hypothetical protein